MDSTGLTRLVAELLYAVQALAGYAGPAQAPLVEFLPQVELRAMACDGTCDIRGWYAGGSTIYLDDRLDPAGNLWDRGILVHEIVHYVQELAGAFGASPTCQRWLEREHEAYALQRRWLRANRPTAPPPSYARFPRISIDCDG